MDLQLTNKKALVTGSTAGIGFAIASLLAQEGAAVIVTGRSRQRVEQAVGRIQKETKNAQVTGVAAMVVYVCSPRASATNGAALRVDGGVVRSIL
jgi:NAD(P)-dependent dehydrogenase (short-subunit alcohol dehydrogenase family)